jgi:DNA-binding MarR family transcriptional regulator
MPEERKSGRGGYLLGVASRLSARVFSRLLKEAGYGELEPGQGRILFLVTEKGPLFQRELAALAGLDKSSLALTLDRMEAKGLVARRPDPADGRRSIVEALPGALPSPKAYAEVSRAMNALFYKGFTEQERRSFEAMLARIVANLEDAR